MSEWLADIEDGIRRYRYSSDKSTNPLTFRHAWGMDERHDIGTVWATMLHEVL